MRKTGWYAVAALLVALLVALAAGLGGVRPGLLGYGRVCDCSTQLVGGVVEYGVLSRDKRCDHSATLVPQPDHS